MTQAAQNAVKVLSTDIVTLEGKVYRKIREKRLTGERTPTGRAKYVRIDRLEPVDVTFHANPVGLGVLAAAGAIGAAFLFGRLNIPLPLGGAVELYKGPLADEFDKWKVDYAARRKQRELERIAGGYIINGVFEEKPSKAAICGELQRRFEADKAGKNYTDQARWKRQAIANGCAWAQ